MGLVLKIITAPVYFVFAVIFQSLKIALTLMLVAGIFLGLLVWSGVLVL